MRREDKKCLLFGVMLLGAVLFTDGWFLTNIRLFLLIFATHHLPQICLHAFNDRTYMTWRPVVFIFSRLTGAWYASQAVESHNQTVTLTGIPSVLTFLVLGSSFVYTVFTAFTTRLSPSIGIAVGTYECIVSHYVTTASIIRQLQQSPAGIYVVEALWDAFEIYGGILPGMQYPFTPTFLTEHCWSNDGLQDRAWRVLSMLRVLHLLAVPTLANTSAPQPLLHAGGHDSDDENEDEDGEGEGGYVEEEPKAVWQVLLEMPWCCKVVPLSLLAWYTLPCSWPQV
jgi:hypothetical protein